jgi:hypothetical protein
VSPVACVLALSLGAALLAGCAPEARPTPHKPVEPPAASPDAIPEAPLNGTLRGAPFVVRDARYVADHRTGYAHVDIKLSAGSAEASCGAIAPAGSSSVWLRLERSDKIEAQDLRLTPGQESPWSVHYQVRESSGWVGSAEAAAVVSLRAAGPDGRLEGGLAVCFADDAKSCVSGTFAALPCPPGIDAPVRGTLPPEAIPEAYAKKLRAVVAPLGSASALPAAKTPP